MPASSATLDIVALTAFIAGLVYAGGQAATELAAQSALRDDRRALSAEVRALRADRSALEQRIAGLAGPEIDPELLDEHLRRVHGLGRADEVLLIGPELR